MLTLGIVASILMGACATPTEEPAPAPTEVPPPVATEVPAEEPTDVPLVPLVVWADELRAPIINELGAEFATAYGVEFVVQEMGFGDIRVFPGFLGYYRRLGKRRRQGRFSCCDNRDPRRRDLWRRTIRQEIKMGWYGYFQNRKRKAGRVLVDA